MLARAVRNHLTAIAWDAEDALTSALTQLDGMSSPSSSLTSKTTFLLFLPFLPLKTLSCARTAMSAADIYLAMLASWHPDIAKLKLSCPRVAAVWDKVARVDFVKKTNAFHKLW